MADLEILSIPVLADNFVHVIRDPEDGACAIVDPAVAAPVLEELERLKWHPTHIFCTHHHNDHIGGVQELKRATGCSVVAAAGDLHRIPGVDQPVTENDVVRLGHHAARVFEVPGHTSGHVAYWFGNAHALFCGDTLFSLGCGRLFEGTPAQMWASLCKLRKLPDATRLYFGHEYTQENARFALTLEPANEALKTRAAEVAALRSDAKPTVPSLLGNEKAANPFLRADVPEFQKAVGLAGHDAVSVFAEVRKRKDHF